MYKLIFSKIHEFLIHITCLLSIIFEKDFWLAGKQFF